MQVEFVSGDVSDPKAVEKAVEGVEVVFHHAALASVPRSVTNPAETHAADATGTVTLLDACRQADVRRVVYAASSSCYGNRPEMPKLETHLPQVLSPYAAAKLAGELYCEAFAACYALETVRLRYFNVFGPRQDPKGPYAAVIPLFVTALLEGRRPTILAAAPNRGTSPTLKILSRRTCSPRPCRKFRAVFTTSPAGHSSSVLELLKEICEILGKPFDPALPRRVRATCSIRRPIFRPRVGNLV